MREKDALLPEDAKLGADFRRDRYADETLLIDGNGRVEKGTVAAAFQIVHHRRQLAEVELHVWREAEGAEGGGDGECLYRVHVEEEQRLLRKGRQADGCQM